MPAAAQAGTFLRPLPLICRPPAAAKSRITTLTTLVSWEQFDGEMSKGDEVVPSILPSWAACSSRAQKLS